MANKQADELRAKLKPGAGLEFLDELDKDSLTLLNKALDDAKQREHVARCRCMACISTAGSRSSTNATCLFRNSRQSIS